MGSVSNGHLGAQPRTMRGMVSLYPDMNGWPVPIVPVLHREVHGKSLLDLMVSLMLVRRPEIVSDSPGRGLFNNLVRLTDKAVVEYDTARVACEEFAATVRNAPRVTDYFRAIDHFENCLNALHRALLHAEAIKSTATAPAFDRNQWRALASVRRRLTSFRDAIEHTDDRMKSHNEEQWTGPAFLVLTVDHLAIQNDHHIIKYRELGQWIHQVYRLMRALMDD